MAGDVVATGTRAADTAPVDAPRGTDPVADAEQTEATAAGVPGRRAAEDAPPAPPDPPDASDPASDPGASAGSEAAGAQDLPNKTARPSPARPSQARPGRARAAVAAVQGQAADVAASGVGVRRRLARLGAQRSGGVSPVLDPLVKTVRSTHPKADIRLIERAYETNHCWLAM